MNPTKTIMLRLKPIAEITEDEMKEEVLATDGFDYTKGNVATDRDCNYYVESDGFGIIFNITHYAVLPKDE